MSLVRSEKDECSAVWDEASGAWQITACPALRPTAREQVVHLRACLNRMLQAEQAQRETLQAEAGAWNHMHTPHAAARDEHAHATCTCMHGMCMGICTACA